jgi:hypothetical protein
LTLCKNADFNAKRGFTAFPGRSIRLSMKAESIMHFDFTAARSPSKKKRNTQGTQALHASESTALLCGKTHSENGLNFSLAVHENPERKRHTDSGKSHYEFWANCREIQAKTLLELQERIRGTKKDLFFH